MVVSAKSSDDHAFKYYRGHEIVKDAEKAFYDIKRNRDEELYIQLNFKDSHKSIEYLGILEENPFIPDDHFITDEDKEEIDQFLNHSVRQQEINIISRKIDEALDARNEEMFYELCKQLNKVRAN